MFVLDVNMSAVGFAGPMRSCISAKQGRFPLLVVGDALPLLTSLLVSDTWYLGTSQSCWIIVQTVDLMRDSTFY